MTHRIFGTGLALTALLLGSLALTRSNAQTPAAKAPVIAAEEKSPVKPAESSSTPKSPSETEEQAQSDREAAAWGFVMKHHPQLGEVLSRLKIMHISQYEKAITQITYTAERISRLQKADQKRGEMELEDWKLGSQIQLAAAKLSLAKEDPELQQELSKIVRKQMEQRLKITEYERDKLQARLKVLDEQAAKQKEQLANSAELRVKEMLREINKTRKNLQNESSKKAAKSKTAE